MQNEEYQMVTRKAATSTVKVPEKRGDETSTEKFLRECAERAALPELKKVRKFKKCEPEKSVKRPFPTTQEEVAEIAKQIFANTSKRQLRASFKRSSPWLFRPEAIRKQIFTLVRKEHSFAFAKQLTLVLSLSFKVSDYYEQLGAMNPGLSKAQRDGTIEHEIWKTVSELNDAWKKLITMP
jgi:hypothetical protein